MSDYIDFMEQQRGEPMGAVASVIAGMQRQEADENRLIEARAVAAQGQAESLRTAEWQAGIRPGDIQRMRDAYAAAADRVTDLRAQLERAERALANADAERALVLERMDKAASILSRSQGRGRRPGGAEPGYPGQPGLAPPFRRR